MTVEYIGCPSAEYHPYTLLEPLLLPALSCALPPGGMALSQNKPPTFSDKTGDFNLKLSSKLLVFLIFILVGIDQLMKTLVQVNISEGNTIAVIPRFFQINYVINVHGRWILSVLDFPFWFKAIGVSFGFFVPLLVYLFYKFYQWKWRNSIWLQLFLVFVFSAAIGNSLDLLVLGYVRDFLHFFKFPIMNFADLFIGIGLSCLVIEWVKNPEIHLKDIFTSPKKEVEQLKQFKKYLFQ